MKNIKGKHLRVGDVDLVITQGGDVALMENGSSIDGHIEFRAAQLDKIVAALRAAKAIHKLVDGLPRETLVNKYDITYHGMEVDDLVVEIGCQWLTEQDILGVHKLSLAMRKANKGKRK